MREVAGQGLRFALVGGAATLTHVVAALVAGGQGLPPSAANLAGYAAAVGVSYWGHARFTFAARGHRRQLPRFLAVSLAGLAASAAITHAACDLAGLPLAAAMALVAAVVPASSFAASRLWAFAPARAAQG